MNYSIKLFNLILSLGDSFYSQHIFNFNPNDVSKKKPIEVWTDIPELLQKRILVN